MNNKIPNSQKPKEKHILHHSGKWRWQCSPETLSGRNAPSAGEGERAWDQENSWKPLLLGPRPMQELIPAWASHLHTGPSQLYHTGGKVSIWNWGIPSDRPLHLSRVLGLVSLGVRIGNIYKLLNGYADEKLKMAGWSLHLSLASCGDCKPHSSRCIN